MTRTRLEALVLLAVAFSCLLVRAQDTATILRARIAQCAVHSVDGSWVPKELYPDGVLRLTYLYEPPKEKPGEYDYRDGSHNVYAAFWSRDGTKGELLQFLWLRRRAPIHLRIMNNGHIVAQQGKIDIEDALGGVWTHEHLMRRVARLKIAPLQTVPVREIPSNGAICDSYGHVANDSVSASAPKQRRNEVSPVLITTYSEPVLRHSANRPE